MRISLIDPIPKRLAEAEGFTVVGTCDDGVLAYGANRAPYKLTLHEDVPLDRTEVNRALADAVTKAGEKIWPGGFGHAMANAFRMSRRGLQPERLARDGLNPNIARQLAEIARREDAMAYGYALAFTSKMMGEFGLDRESVEQLMPQVLDMQEAQRARAKVVQAGFETSPVEDDVTDEPPAPRI